MNKILILGFMLLLFGCIQAPAEPQENVTPMAPSLPSGNATVEGLPKAEIIKVAIDAGKTGEQISKYVRGQFIEHQGRCIYGGIWAEMLEDRKFFYPVDDPRSPWMSMGAGAVTMDGENPYVGNSTPRITVSQHEPNSIMQGNLALEQGRDYSGRIILAGDESVTVDVVLAWGDKDEDRQVISITNLSGTYAKFPLNFTAAEDAQNGTIEIMGSGQGSFSIGAVSLMPADNIKGMRADTLRLLKELNATVYRWPGGNFVNNYNWSKAVGDPDKRPTIENSAYWSTVLESNDFGPDEFMAFVDFLDAEAFIAVSAFNESDALMAVSEVEYFNGPATSPMGALRAQNGHPEPYNVTWWGVGNEMWVFTTPDAYYPRHNEISDAMKAKDPSIKIIGVGGQGYMNWSRTMLENSADHMDLIGEHFYVEPEGNTTAGAVRDMTGFVRGFASKHRKFMNELETLKDKDIRIALEEWNWGTVGKKEYYGEAGVRYNFQEALGTAAGMNEITRNSDVIFMANSHPVNVHGGIKTTKTDAAFETTGLVLKLYNNHFADVPIDLGRDYDPLEIAVAKSSDGKLLTIAAVNPHPRAFEIDLELTNAKLEGSGKHWLITHSDPMAYNEPGKPPNVFIEEENITDSGRLSVPSLSINIYELQIQAGAP